jgi:hypothetical protein
MVNDTEYLPSLTDVNGYFRLSLDLQPVNNQSTTYMITASFEDTSQEPLNCTAWAKTLDGQDYAVCTTVQYGYKPSTNYASVTVEPRATQITADEGTSVSQANETTTQSSAQVPPQKTPEEMQKEAEDNGALKIWHEFSWWPPWYRLHINATIGGNAWIHAAFNPVLPILGGEVQTFGFENIVPPLPSTTTPPNLPPPPNTNVSDELTSLVLKEFFAFSFPMAAAIATANIPAIPAAIVAMGVYGGFGFLEIYDAYHTYFSNEWGAHTKAFAKFMTLLVMLVAAIVGTELSFSAGMVLKTLMIPTLSSFLSNLINPVALQSTLNSWWLSSLNALFAGLALLKIPNPFMSSQYFKWAFIITNIILIGVTFGFLVGLPI